MKNFIRLNKIDNVVTVTKNIKEGFQIENFITKDEIPISHKVSSSKIKKGEGITPNRRWDVAISFPILFMNAINIAGIIPTNGPTNGIKLATPAIIPIKIINDMLAPIKFKITKPNIDINPTLNAAMN